MTSYTAFLLLYDRMVSRCAFGQQEIGGPQAYHEQVPELLHARREFHVALALDNVSVFIQAWIAAASVLSAV